ncbi:MAG: hypothetical protein ACI9U2_001152 [Bradymonadia bacterium]|jgi:hypothetical protein
MSRFGFDEQGRALDAEARDATPQTDPLAIAARAQSAELDRARAAIADTDATAQTLPDLLRHAATLPDVQAALLGGARPIWDRWVPVLESTRLTLSARRDLAVVAHQLPDARKVAVLERVFHVQVGADARAVDDLLDDAAEMPAADAESVLFEDDATVHLSGPEALLEGLFDAPTSAAYDDAATLSAVTADAEALWTGGAERRVDVASFVRACAPQVANRGRAEAVVGACFGGGDVPVGDAPNAADSADWWRQVRRLSRRFPMLVEALEAARDGAEQRVAVRGGYARVDLAAGTLGLYMPANADANRS